MPDFDPYHRWLGIPPDERPISKYRLLALGEYEGDPEVINAAAEGRTIFLRTMQAGEHESLVAQLLNEISSARVTLLDPEQKSAYDAQLRIERMPKQAPPPTASPIVQPAAPAVSLPTPPPSGPRNVATPREQTGFQVVWKRPKVIGLSIAGGLLILIIFFMLGGSNEKHPSTLWAAGSSSVSCLAFSPDGTRLITGVNEIEGGGKVKVWDAQSGRELKTLNSNNNIINSVAFSSDGRTVASGDAKGIIRLWDSRSGDELKTLDGHSGKVRNVMSVAFSPDGNTIASGSTDHTIKLWDVQSGVEIKTLTENSPVDNLAFSPDGSAIACVARNRPIKLLDSKSGELIKTLTPDNQDKTSNRAVSFSPDGTRIVSSKYSGAVKVWDVRTGQETLTLEGHSRDVRSVNFSPDGTRIVSASYDGTGKVWDIQSRSELTTLTLTEYPGHMYSIAFSPDGSTIAGGGMAIIPDGRTYVRVGTIKLWHSQNGTVLKTLTANSKHN